MGSVSFTGGKKVVGRRIKHLRGSAASSGAEDPPASASKRAPSGERWEAASVLSFASRSGRYRLLYDEGGEAWVKLREADVEFLDGSAPMDGEVGVDETGPGGRREGAAVGRRLRVYYGRKRMWLDAKVEEYDAAKRKHLLSYVLGGTEWVVMGEEQVQWMGGGLPASEDGGAARAVMGKQLKVLIADRDEWKDGTVWEFAPRTNRFHVVYDDGSDAWIDVEKEKVKWEPSAQRALTKRKSKAAAAEGAETKRQKTSASRTPVKVPASAPPPPAAVTAAAAGGAGIGSKADAAPPRAPAAALATEMPKPSSRAGRKNVALGSAGVGRRIRIFMKNTMQWKTGRILNFSPESRSSLVQYEASGTKEWLHLGREHIELLEEGAPVEPASTAAPHAAGGAGAAAATAPAAIVDGAAADAGGQARPKPAGAYGPSGPAAPPPARRAEAGDGPSRQAAAAPAAPRQEKGGASSASHHRRVADRAQIPIVNPLRKSQHAVLPPKPPDPKQEVPRADPRGGRDAEPPPEMRPLGPNAVTLQLPANFVMPKPVFRGSEGGGERSRLLHRMKILDKMIERVAAADRAAGLEDQKVDVLLTLKE